MRPTVLAALLRQPDRPLTASRYLGYVARLVIFYAAVGIVGAAVYAIAMTACALASPSPEQPTPAMVLGCGAHVEGPLSIRDAETGTLLLTIPARDALDTDCGVTDAPMVFDGQSHRAIILHR